MSLEIPFGHEPEPKRKWRILQVKALAMEKWDEENAKFGELLAKQSEIPHRLSDTRDTNRQLMLMEEVLREALSDLYTRSSTGKQRDPLRPLQKFFRRHMWHPQIYRFTNAFKAGERKELNKLTRIIKAAGWRKFLAGVTPSNIPAFYRYIEKEDGGTPRGSPYPCAGLLRSKEYLATTGKQM